jgi:hypothetical protein
MPSILLSSPTKRWLPWVVAACACIAAAVFFLNRTDPDSLASKAGQQQPASAAASQHLGASDAYVLQLPGSEQLSGAPDSTQSPLDTVKPPNFRVDAKGQLILDETFRVDIERVYGLHQGPDVLRKLDEFSTHLPDKAKRELRSQYARYVQYDAAVMQSLASLRNAEEMTLENAERELDILHDLRQTYFGPENAQAMFAQEEAQSKEMHDYIRNQTDPNLPMMQRVELAQAAWLKAHGTPAAQASPSN